ncbi:Calvin cycle protein CP12 [Acaryochloris sp. IP29b_bin.148]|uniref:Calvin cycle protein CP12 n=1 Tax=Acaryochloris sp. IP29b_bin.148 TaxID=2969218 RepID=UPI002629BAD8|nr:Calvin cycle protein CP12 [Acaryochloris sp. IP29b_bin.148]
MPLTLETAPNPTLEQSVAMEKRMQDALSQARETCANEGSSSKACAVAWDIVEELQAEYSHQKVQAQPSQFESYCDGHPNAEECRVYDV